MVNASYRGNHLVSSPTHLSPELEYKTFSGGILESDGDSDPFESPSPPDGDNGKYHFTVELSINVHFLMHQHNISGNIFFASERGHLSNGQKSQLPLLRGFTVEAFFFQKSAFGLSC